MPKHAGAKQQKEDRHCRIVHLLGVFTELQKATISCVMSVCLSVCLHGTTWLPLDRFSFDIFQISVKEIKFH